MVEFLAVTVGFLVAMLGFGLVRVLSGPGDADRMMSAQLIGTCGIAALLIVGVLGGTSAAIDVALVLALLSTFAAAAFAESAGRPSSPQAPPQQPPRAEDP